MRRINRREMLRQATGAIAGAKIHAQQTSGAAYLFPGFKTSKVETSGATINVVSGGQGPPLLLLHGAPQSHATWYSFKNPATVHAMCEDYRAAASIDLEHDEADINRKISCPLLVLWSERGAMGRLYDVLGAWRERASNVTGKLLAGGHSLQEDKPEETLAELRAFLNAG